MSKGAFSASVDYSVQQIIDVYTDAVNDLMIGGQFDTLVANQRAYGSGTPVKMGDDYWPVSGKNTINDFISQRFKAELPKLGEVPFPPDWNEIYTYDGPNTDDYFNELGKSLVKQGNEANKIAQAQFDRYQQMKAEQKAAFYDPLLEKNRAVEQQLSRLRGGGVIDEYLRKMLNRAKSLGMDTSKYEEVIPGTYNIAGARNVVTPEGGIMGTGEGVEYATEQQKLAWQIYQDIQRKEKENATLQGKAYARELPQEFTSLYQQLQGQYEQDVNAIAPGTAAFQLADAGWDASWEKQLGASTAFESLERDPYEAFYQMIRKNPQLQAAISQKQKERIKADPYYATYLQRGADKSYMDYLAGNPELAAKREKTMEYDARIAEGTRKQDLLDRLYGRRRISTPTRWL